MPRCQKGAVSRHPRVTGAMPLADRNPLAAAEVRINELQAELAAARRESTEAKRQQRYWASQALKLKRSNMFGCRRLFRPRRARCPRSSPTRCGSRRRPSWS
eukprot:2175003-Prymnesium_polylepis.1